MDRLLCSVVWHHHVWPGPHGVPPRRRHGPPRGARVGLPPVVRRVGPGLPERPHGRRDGDGRGGQVRPAAGQPRAHARRLWQGAEPGARAGGQGGGRVDGRQRPLRLLLDGRLARGLGRQGTQRGRVGDGQAHGVDDVRRRCLHRGERLQGQDGPRVLRRHDGHVRPHLTRRALPLQDHGGDGGRAAQGALLGRHPGVHRGGRLPLRPPARHALSFPQRRNGGGWLSRKSEILCLLRHRQARAAWSRRPVHLQSRRLCLLVLRVAVTVAWGSACA
mmetsp:Transcript_24281/g.80707  ORF Transcript_24281/g.80707 Transcript_24281/m.80707 type:complete len:275 (+) Transcript_24281:264-1088(+)